MLNNVKIFFMILYVSMKLTWTGKVTVILTKLYKINQYPFHHNQ